MDPRQATESDHRQRVGFLLARVGRSSWSAFEQALAPLGLRPRHVVVLMEVRQSHNPTQRSLQDTLGFDAAALVGLLNTLEQRGLLSRTRDPADRRRHLVELTPAGRMSLDEADETLARAEGELLSSLDEQERELLGAVLLKVAAGGVPADLPRPASGPGRPRHDAGQAPSTEERREARSSK